MFLSFNLCMLVLAYQFVASIAWNYKMAVDWPQRYAKCGGSKQSPIDVSQNLYLAVTKWPPLAFEGTDKMPSSVTLVNTGHTLQVDFEWPEDPPSLSGGSLNATYLFGRIHFHWPSEHTFRGQRFLAEMQVGYYNEKYESFETAMKKENGIAVAVAFFSAGNESNALSILLANASNVTNPGSKVDVSPFSLDTFTPAKPNYQFCVYSGSLVHPPCTEIATWIISLDILSASSEQLNILWTTHLAHGDTFNARPLQPLNNRKIHLIHSTDAVGQ